MLQQIGTTLLAIIGWWITGSVIAAPIMFAMLWAGGESDPEICDDPYPGTLLHSTQHNGEGQQDHA